MTQTSTSKQLMIHITSSSSADMLPTSNTFSIKLLGFRRGVVKVSVFLGCGTAWLDDWRPTFRDNCGLKTFGTHCSMTQHHVAEERRLQRNKYVDKIFEIRVRSRLEFDIVDSQFFNGVICYIFHRLYFVTTGIWSLFNWQHKIRRRFSAVISGSCNHDMAPLRVADGGGGLMYGG
jgi:hypothetical protein